MDSEDAAPVEQDTPPPEPAAPTGTTRPRQRSSIPQFLFFTFLLFMLTSHSGDEFLARHQYQDVKRSLGEQLGNYTAWLNGTETNFTMVSKCAHVRAASSF